MVLTIEKEEIRNKQIETDKLEVPVDKKLEINRKDETLNAYNNIIHILATLDMYSANMLVNLLWLQTAHKTYEKTVGKEEVETDE